MMLAPNLRQVSCNFAEHGLAVQQIFNHAIATSTALYEYHPRTLSDIEHWFLFKADKQLPVIGIENSQRELLGFASFGPFRPQIAYQYTVEHSLYLRPQAQGQGLGRYLLTQVITAAQQLGYRQLIGMVDSENQPSIVLHQRLGFAQVGYLKQVGYKFERELDVVIFQRDLQHKSC